MALIRANGTHCRIRLVTFAVSVGFGARLALVPAEAAPGGVEGGALPRPVSSGEILEAKNQYLVAGSSGPAECDSAWSGEGTPLVPAGRLPARHESLPARDFRPAARS
jgi:hypothetical protein